MQNVENIRSAQLDIFQITDKFILKKKDNLVPQTEQYHSYFTITLPYF